MKDGDVRELTSQSLDENSDDRLLKRSNDHDKSDKDKDNDTAADPALRTAAVALLGAMWKDKTLRKHLLKQVSKQKFLERGGRAVVSALLDMKVIRKKQLKKIAGKKLAKKLVA